MIGAIIGDVVGSRFEFHNHKSKYFELITSGCEFTDDTVLTIAVMDWLLHSNKKTQETASEYLRKWGLKYPFAGYGGRFNRWLHTPEMGPYGSKGNGNAMRISPVGWASNDLEKVSALSDIVTGATHNHSEGIRGARVVATLIAMARIGKTKEQLKQYISQYYNVEFNYDELKMLYTFNELSENTIPQAFYCFLISNDFEDCLRTTVSIGGDTDTLCAISCAIAEAYYKKIPDSLVKKVKSKLTQEMLDVVNEFEKQQSYNFCKAKKEI